MGLTARNKGGSLTPIPQDLHLAVCYAIYDIGTQFSERYSKSIHKVIIIWELPECLGEFEMEDGTKKKLPRSISKRYRLSLHEKADLRKDLENWRGRKFTDEELKGFDLKKLLGVPCQIQVVHNTVNGQIYSNISAITKVPTGTKVQPVNPHKFFSFEEPNHEIPAGTPQWVTDLIKQSSEFKGGNGTNGREPGEDYDGPPEDDIPF